jgi:hypothetical protein
MKQTIQLVFKDRSVLLGYINAEEEAVADKLLENVGKEKSKSWCG